MKKFILALMALVIGTAAQPLTAQTLKVLHLFDFQKEGEGSVPHAPLLRDAAGNLYGTTLDGGSGNGTVFKIDSTGKETILLAFDPATTGSSPDTTVIQDQVGNLYGIGLEGGPSGGGTIYKISPQGEVTVLHAFQVKPKNSPAIPTGGLFRDQSGNIFGTTFSGGVGDCPLGCGTLFRLDTAGRLHLLHKFAGGSDGNEPFGPLVQDANGNLYGVTRGGGDLNCPDAETQGNGCGTVFKLARNGKLTVLHTFHGGDGATPEGGLAMDANGNLYGVTRAGGNVGHGTVFKIFKNGEFATLHRFVRRDGTNPNGGLVLDKAGNIFGTALSNGGHNLGSVFQLSPFGQLTVLHYFRGRGDGGSPSGGVVRDEAGTLYGTTSMTVFKRRFRGGVFQISF
jgi:uncharacterized repeat protein (TIGR03803 family)